MSESANWRERDPVSWRVQNASRSSALEPAPPAVAQPAADPAADAERFDRVWQRHVLALREQIAAMQGGPMMLRLG